MDLKSRAIEGAFWNIFFALINKLITFIGQFSLAWFLAPTDMGLANMAQAMTAFTAIFYVGGLGDVLLQRRKLKEETGQAFLLSIGLSTLTATIICGLALVCPLFGKRELQSLLWFLAVSVLIGAPATIIAAKLKNNLDYKSLAFSQFLGGLSFTLTAVFLAWRGWGPLALIIPLIPQQLITMFVMWSRGGKFSLATPAWDKLRELVKPTLLLSVSNLLIGLKMQSPIFICGMVLGTTQTGFFSWGFLVASQTVFLMSTNLREVLLPTLTQIIGEEERIARTAQKTAHAITAFLCVTCGLQGLLAEPLIRLCLPTKWYPAIPLVIVFSLGLVSQGVWVSGVAWLNSSGKYRMLLGLSVFQVILNSGFTWLGIISGEVLGAAIGCATSNLIGGMVYIWLLNKKSPESQWTSWVTPSLLTLLLWPICFLISWNHKLVLQVLSALIFVGLDCWIWWRSDKGGLKSVLEKVVQKIQVLRYMSNVV